MKQKQRDIELLEKIAKIHKIKRKKHQALKTGKMQVENILEETFRPITEPLEQISKKIKIEVPERDKPIKHEEKLKFKMETSERDGREDEYSTPSPFKQDGYFRHTLFSRDSNT